MTWVNSKDSLAVPKSNSRYLTMSKNSFKWTSRFETFVSIRHFVERRVGKSEKRVQKTIEISAGLLAAVAQTIASPQLPGPAGL
jgi:hypothetical protein